MFRCTECNTEYEIKPDFCECGNDEFIETAGSPSSYQPQEQEVYQEAKPSSIFEQNALNPQPKYREEEEEERFNFDPSFVKKKKITLITVGISVAAALVLFLLVGNDTPQEINDSPEKTAALNAKKEQLAKKIPDVDSFWDDTPAFRSSGSGSTVPLLNTNFKNLGSELKQYIFKVGKAYSENWDLRSVSGSGICKIEFIINRDGSFAKSNIVSKSENQSLNDSVNMAISQVAKVDPPPKGYHGERVQLAFEITKDRKPKMYYP